MSDDDLRERIMYHVLPTLLYRYPEASRGRIARLAWDMADVTIEARDDPKIGADPDPSEDVKALMTRRKAAKR